MRRLAEVLDEGRVSAASGLDRGWSVKVVIKANKSPIRVEYAGADGMAKMVRGAVEDALYVVLPSDADYKVTAEPA